MQVKLKIKESNYCSKDQSFLSLIHISEPTRPRLISYAVFCLKKKNVIKLLKSINFARYLAAALNNLKLAKLDKVTQLFQHSVTGNIFTKMIFFNNKLTINLYNKFVWSGDE